MNKATNPMLIGYVSDENYLALADVLLEFASASGSWEARSRASGAVYGDLPEGEYQVTLQKRGFGAKRVRVAISSDRPHHFRLLSDRLAGYAWPKWTRWGASSEFRVHSVEPYKLELWRYGLEKEFVRHLGWHDEHGPRATMQIAPDGDYTQSGVQWNKTGYSSSTHRQFVEAPVLSGLYYFHAQTENGDRFGFPWIVAPARPSAQIAVLASNITWNAYNNFGGRSNYINPAGLPATPTVNARLDLNRYTDSNHMTWSSLEYPPLSFDRPELWNHIPFDVRITDPIESRNACALAAAEWRLLGWLEREGFAYDFYAEPQLHDGTLDLTAYRVLVLNCHPEYWTTSMYRRVKSWVHEHGGRLAYLGGNGLNCVVDLINDHAMVVHNGRIKSLWPEGIGAESRFAREMESEAKLLGVVFDPKGIMSGAPYRVLHPDHWAFKGTGLRAGDLFGVQSLHMRCPGGASGHETDKRSASSPAQVQLLAKGTNLDDGGAEMTLYEMPSGGQVFAAGSICYPSSLLVDEPLSQITANVLRRFLD
jgi:hypothetical protein